MGVDMCGGSDIFGSETFLQPDTLSAARESQQGNESTINQRKQEMI